MWFIGIEVEQETSAPPPKKNPRSAPDYACEIWSSHAWPGMTELFHMHEKILHVIKCMEKKFTHMTKYDFISSFLFSSITSHGLP